MTLEGKDKDISLKLPGIVSQLYEGLTSKKLEGGRAVSLIGAALELKQLDEDASYALAAVAITEAATRLNLSQPAGELVERAVKYCTKRSKYLREQE